MELMLPIVQKIQNSSLVLQNYGLQEGQLHGLAKSIWLLGQPKIKHLLLDSCKVTDTMAANLFQALASKGII